MGVIFFNAALDRLLKAAPAQTLSNKQNMIINYTPCLDAERDRSGEGGLDQRPGPRGGRGRVLQHSQPRHHLPDG